MELSNVIAIVAAVFAGVSGMFAGLSWWNGRRSAVASETAAEQSRRSADAAVLARRPRVWLDVDEVPGAPSWPGRREGQYDGNEAIAIYLAGTVHVAGSAIITGVRMASATDDASWDDLPEPDVYVGDPAQPDSGRRESGMGIAQIPDEYHQHRLPQPLTDTTLVLRVEHSRPLPNPINEHDGARLWVETDTGDRFLSPVGMLNERYRGPNRPRA